MKFYVGIVMLIVGISSSTVDSSFAGTGKELKVFGVRHATIYYDVQGSQTGTVTQYIRDWGAKQVNIIKTTMSVGGFEVKTDQKTINEGEWVINVDYVRKVATRTRNPMYQSIVKNLKNKDGVEAGKEYMKALGAKETGETKKIAGEKCEVWQVPSMGMIFCVAKDGLPLLTQSRMQGFSFTQTATKVVRGNPGPANVYKVDPGIPLQEQQLPDMNSILQNRSKRGSASPYPPSSPEMEKMPDMEKLMEQLKQFQGAQ